MEQSNKLNKLQMTSGPILKNIVIFAVPLMLTNLLQVFYSVSDTVVVSLSSEQDAVGAIGTTTAMINLIVNIFIGCSVGARVAMAQCLGAMPDPTVYHKFSVYQSCRQADFSGRSSHHRQRTPYHPP